MLEYSIGEYMINPKNIEIVFDALNESAMLLFEKNKTPYLKGLVFTCESILSQEIDIDVTDEDRQVLLDHIHRIGNISFDKEEIRKALQLCILKGYKLSKRSNQDITPDTIGIFTAYLVDKLFEPNREIIILDPLVGTGNLLTTIGNHLKRKTMLIGIENQPEQYGLARVMLDMMDYGDEVYFQDSLIFWNLEADLIVCDFSYDEELDGHYFPYEVIRHHRYNLKPEGYFVGVIYNDFFDKSESETFRKELLVHFDILGLIKLPDSLFKSIGKSIILFQKKGEETSEEKQFLLADIPSFEEEAPFQKALLKINQWFENILRKSGE